MYMFLCDGFSHRHVVFTFRSWKRRGLHPGKFGGTIYVIFQLLFTVKTHVSDLAAAWARIHSFILFFYPSHSFTTVEFPCMHSTPLQTGFDPPRPEFSISLPWQILEQLSQLRVCAFSKRLWQLESNRFLLNEVARSVGQQSGGAQQVLPSIRRLVFSQ